MNNRIPEYFQLQKYNIASEDIVKLNFKCEPDVIRPTVIITPIWRANIFEEHVDTFTTISKGIVYELIYHGKKITLIRSGIGAPQSGDIVLALGCTPCNNIIFTGSVGGLDTSMKIGDFVLAEKSICGDGFSRYLDSAVLTKDCFFKPVYPDKNLTSIVKKVALEFCKRETVPLHQGTIFSTDSLIAQFSRIDYIRNKLNCIGIEMETSAVFKASRLVKIKACAILQISDIITINKSLFSGRTKEDMEKRKFIKEKLLPRLILDSAICAVYP